jgi:transducin (beta)-like 1
MTLQFCGKYQLTPAHNGAITCVAFSCNGDYIASGGLDRKLQIFSLADGRLHYSVTIPGPIKSLIWHPGTEQMLFCACNNGVLIDVTIIAGVSS